MNTTDRDKSEWPKGPWSTEVDRCGWIDEDTGYACQIVRVMGSGHLCGYVQIPAEHPLYGVGYSSRITKRPTRELFGGWYLIEDSYDTTGGLFEVHGGVTYSGNGDFFDEGSGWWYGFDCGHAGDLSPAYEYGSNGTYRDADYVKAECASLAKQLKQVIA